MFNPIPKPISIGGGQTSPPDNTRHADSARHQALVDRLNSALAHRQRPSTLKKLSGWFSPSPPKKPTTAQPKPNDKITNQALKELLNRHSSLDPKNKQAILTAFGPNMKRRDLRNFSKKIKDFSLTSIGRQALSKSLDQLSKK